MLFSGKVSLGGSLGPLARSLRQSTRRKNCHPWRSLHIWPVDVLWSAFKMWDMLKVGCWLRICHQKVPFVWGKLTLMSLCCSCLIYCNMMICVASSWWIQRAAAATITMQGWSISIQQTNYWMVQSRQPGPSRNLENDRRNLGAKSQIRRILKPRKITV